MLEVTEMILASIHATPMSHSEIEELPYLKTISDYGINFSLDMLIKKDYIKEKVYKKKLRYTVSVRTEYRCTKKGEKYLVEHGYLE